MKKDSLWIDVLLLLGKLLLLGILFFVLFFVCFSCFSCRDGGMYPSVKQGDLVISYRLDKEYRANDAVALEVKGKKQVRRVVALPGDTVEIDEEGLKVNKIRIQEQKIYEETTRFEGGIAFPVTLKEGEIFLLGDARGQAEDSRSYGPVQKKDTLGKVVTILRRRDI